MKCIEKAMSENRLNKPKKGWWGFCLHNKRYLCRYNHIFAVFSESEVLYSNYETKTDYIGVTYALKYFNDNIKNGQNR